MATAHPDFVAPTSWYDMTCKEPPLAAPTLVGRVEARVAVVGGGLAGLAAALSLAERGVAVVLVEAGAVGQGASGRNGGLLLPGFSAEARTIARRLGPVRTATLLARARAAVGTVRERVKRWGIACDLVDGALAVSWYADARTLRAALAELDPEERRHLSVLDGPELRALYATTAWRAGLFDPAGGHLDPLALARGYARAAVGLGAVIHERSPVLGLERQGRGWRVRTPEGEVRAATVVLAGNLEGAGLHPALGRALLPVESDILVTEPLGERLAAAVRRPWAVWDDRFAVGYGRPLADGRLMWGGGVRLGAPARPGRGVVPPAAIADRLGRDLARVFPSLAGAPVAHAWTGRMGFARHRMPIVRELAPTWWAATAFGGHGLNTTTMAGELLAAAIAEGDDGGRLLDPFAPVSAGGSFGRLAARALILGHAAGEAMRRAARRG